MNNKEKKHGNVLFIIPPILLLAGAGYLSYNMLLLTGIENIIRMSIIGGSLILGVILLLISLKIIRRGKLLSLIIFSIICLLLSGVFFAGACFINKAYASISKINKTEYTYTTSLVVMSDSKINVVKDLSKKKIGIINDDKSIDGYIISQQIIKENNIDNDALVKFDGYLEMLNALYDGEINGIFISSTYISNFSPVEKFTNIASETKVILSKSKKVTKKATNSNSQITKPFTILVLGIDAKEDDISKATSFLADTIILLTFNPQTQNSTILSIPRDTYVPIMCTKYKTESKINSSGSCGGEEGVKKTVENLTGINIDYYVKINFKGVVNLVDAVGGIIIDVPYSFCEQNSNRLFGKSSISLNKGIQPLNGEQALAFSRNRHKNPSSLCKSTWEGYVAPMDFGRGQNQQTVINALMNKIKETKSITVIYDLLDLLQKNMDTNISTSQILSLYNIGKNMLNSSASAEDMLSFQKLYLQTHSQTINNASMEIYYQASLDLIVDAMKTNLNIIKPTNNKVFSFSVNEIYEEQIIGKDITSAKASTNKVPNFAAYYTKSTANYWGEKNNVKITYNNVVESSSSLYTDGQIIKQSIAASTLVSSVKSSGITLTIVNKTAAIASNTTNNTRTDCTKFSNKENSNCIIPNFVTENYKASDVLKWTSKLTDESVTVITASTTIKTTNKLKDGYVSSQDVTAYKSLYNLSEKVITLKYYKY